VDELKHDAVDAVASRPRDPAAHLQRARVHRLAEEWPTALAELGRAESLGADADEVGALRAAVLLDAGQAESALREIDRVLARRPDAAGLRFERGRICLALGQTEQAAREFGDAIAALPAPRPEHVMARRDALLAIGRRADALLALDEGMARVGRVASLQLAAVELEVELGRYDGALRRLDQLLAPRPNPAWVARRGDILARAGRRDAARAEYTRALALLEGRSGKRPAKGFDELRRRLEFELHSASTQEAKQ